MHDDPELDDESPADVSMMAARSESRILPSSVLRNALGRNWPKFTSAPGICVVIRVRNSDWIAPLLAAAKLAAPWGYTFDCTQSQKFLAEQVKSAMERLARGQRVMCVCALNSAPQRIVNCADIVVDIDRVSRKDLAKAIRAITGNRARNLHPHDAEGVDLVDAVAAIRANSTAAECVRRIRASKTIVSHDALVEAAPLLSELRGYGEAAEWGDRLLADLAKWRAGEIAFSAIQSRAVLSGPPGVGKTSFVRSLAKSAGLPLFASSMGTLFATTPGYLDSIIKGIDALFADARAAGNGAIVFLDETEGIPSRANLEDRHSSWWVPVVNHFLTVLDGASSSSAGLIVVGATNFPNKLDPALVRPGRFDRILHIRLPTPEDLAHIYRHHLGSHLKGVDLSSFATFAAGSTGAEAEGHVKSALAAARVEGRPMVPSDLMEAICPPSDLSPEHVRRTAVHEAGHAVLSLSNDACSLTSIAITGTESGGRVVFKRNHTVIATAEMHRNEVLQLLAGRAAEEVFLGSVSSGAGGSADSDLARASATVAALRLSWGLGGTLVYAAEAREALDLARRNPALLQAIDGDLKEIYQECLALVRKNEASILAVADRLVAERFMSRVQFLQIISEVAHQRGEGLHA